MVKSDSSAPCDCIWCCSKAFNKIHRIFSQSFMFTPIETENVSPENQLRLVLKFLTNFWREISFPISIFYSIILWYIVFSQRMFPVLVCTTGWSVEISCCFEFELISLPLSMQKILFCFRLQYVTVNIEWVTWFWFLPLSFFLLGTSSLVSESKVALWATIVGLSSCGWNFTRRVTR